MTTRGNKPSEIPLYTVDAFSDQPFHGNPAAVCLVQKQQPLEEAELQSIAAEMNISETAYIQTLNDTDTFKNSSRFSLRWFTPCTEVPLCGHATLASAAVLFYICGNTSSTVTFETKSGDLMATNDGDQVVLDFPLNPSQKQDKTKVADLLKAIHPDNSSILDVEYSPTTKKMVVRLQDSKTRADLENMRIDTNCLPSLEPSGKVKGVIVTLKGSQENGCLDKEGRPYDFVSRYFAPWVGIPEDPVTGSAHTVLADFWRKVFKKNSFYARQCSPRGGDLGVEIQGDRVYLKGKATIVLKGCLSLGRTNTMEEDTCSPSKKQKKAV